MIPDKIKRLILDPDPRLRATNVDVTESWTDLEPAVRKMFKVMYSTGVGVGLAAPQVGWNVNLFVMNADRNKMPKNQRVYWNPKIVALYGEPQPMREGCLSLPRVYGNVMRYDSLILSAETPEGHVHEARFEGLAAQIVQHEMGHLRGQIVTDIFLKEPA